MSQLTSDYTRDLWYDSLMSQKVDTISSDSWRLCRRVAVEDLPKLKRNNSDILDPHTGVSSNKPNKGHWTLWLGDPQPGYLGKLGGDGPSDEELKLKSQIRIALPTVP